MSSVLELDTDNIEVAYDLWLLNDAVNIVL